jgi:glyoxylase-like metal-dependent hydrolase (beta-lactamase superfamily II)
MLPDPRITRAGGDYVQVADGVHRLTPGVCNFYLIEDGGKLVLVDAGAPRDWDLLVRTLTALGRRLDDLEAVLVTHAHSDHTGFAERARTTTNAPVWIHQADAAVAKGAKPAKNDGKASSYLLRVEFYRTLFSLARRGATKLIPIQEVSTFGDGETLQVPGQPRAVHAPGHTAGSAALLLEGRRVLLTGDVLATRNPLTGRVGPQIMPSGLNRDTPQALRSLDVLDGIPADVLLPGHGEPWTEGAAEAARLARLAGPS